MGSVTISATYGAHGDRIGHARPVNFVANDRVPRTVDTFNGEPF